MTGVDPTDLGAWVLKGNADRTDLLQRLAARQPVDRWCVRPGYRARMMREGHPVVLWVSGSRQRLRYGVWGAGTLTGPAEPDPPGESWRVPLDLEILPAVAQVPRDVFRADPRLEHAEVLRQPQGANPSFLTVAQFTALAEYVAEGLGRPAPPGEPTSRIR